MRKLECGCELSADGNHFLSLCEHHGQHVQARLEAAKHPRHSEHKRDIELEKKLVLAGFPVVLARRPAGYSDPNTTAEDLFAHVHEVMRRLE